MKEKKNETKTTAGKILDKIIAVCAVVMLINYSLFLLKLVISPSQLLSYVITFAVLIFVPLCLIFRHKLEKLLKKAFPVFKGIFAAGLIFYVVTFAAMCLFIFAGRSEEIPPEELPEKTVILVYGAKVNGSGENAYPSASLRRRLDTAAELLEKAPDSLCIVSGGQGANEHRPEGDVMKEYLVAKGIAAERIISENTSKNTIENIENSVKIMEDEGLDDYEIACVSTNSHIPRIKILCKKQGITPICCYYAPSPDPFTLYTGLVREYMSYGKLLLTGHL